jgi:tetratricopeptide (TPR) repeat protein
MKVSAKTIKEDLARCKSYYMRGEDLRTLGSLASGLKGFLTVKLAASEKAEIETMFRESFSFIGKLPRAVKFMPKGAPYLKGQEEKLLKLVTILYGKVHQDMERETQEQMRTRKLKIDQLILKGQKHLEEGNLLEAQRSFREAVANRVDEDGLFPMLALKLQEKGHFKASLEYLKGAIEVSPENSRAYDLLRTSLDKLGELEPGLKILADVKKKSGESPYLQETMAWALAKSGQWSQALAEAEQALAANPELDLAAKVKREAQGHLKA